jgi:hypothetical protein
MKKPKENKVVEPAENKDGVSSVVWIRINHNRAIAGLGVAGDEVQVSQLVANNFVAQGLATIIDPAPSVLQTSPPNGEEQERHLGEKDL